MGIAVVGLAFAFLEQNSLSLLGRTFEKLPGTVEGTGFGIMGIFLNTGLIIVPPLVGFAASESGSYASQNLLYIASLTAGLLVSLIMAVLPGGRGMNTVTGAVEAEAEAKYMA